MVNEAGVLADMVAIFFNLEENGLEEKTRAELVTTRIY